MRPLYRGERAQTSGAATISQLLSREEPLVHPRHDQFPSQSAPMPPLSIGTCRLLASGRSPPFGGVTQQCRISPWGEEERAGQDKGLMLLIVCRNVGVFLMYAASLQDYAAPASPGGARLTPQHPRNVGDRGVILRSNNSDLFTARYQAGKTLNFQVCLNWGLAKQNSFSKAVRGILASRTLRRPQLRPAPCSPVPSLFLLMLFSPLAILILH